VTSEAVTQAYLSRIEGLDPKIQAYEFVAGDQALATARAMDAMIAAGTDLGPLMGVPVALKDLLAVDGMPTTGGSLVDLSDLIGPEGTFVKTLKRCGCVILGKATMVELAFGALGINRLRTPWNPWDPDVHRICGGSSSGSGAAVAAGLCAFAIGSDTGGSVRLPSSACGTFGLRTAADLWPKDGFLPLVPNLDTIGPLTKSAADAAIVLAALTGRPVVRAAPLDGLRLGKPRHHFYDNLAPEVERCMTAALDELRKAGVSIVPVDTPEAEERFKYFPVAMPAYAIGLLGRERFLKMRDNMDQITAIRCDAGLEVKAAEFIRLERRRQELVRIAHAKLEGLDAWVTPTMAITAPPVADFADVKDGMRLTLAITQATQPASLFGLAASSSPIHMYGSDRPVGLHLLGPASKVEGVLSVALAVEQVTGLPPVADMAPFMS
jgi:aspartyl-tRNA(Asn)/glutamyl-tRNA(Gln) amidotransferase subunit A